MKLKFPGLGSAQAAATTGGKTWFNALGGLTRGRRRAAHGEERLREVLNRDRALAVSARVQQRSPDGTALPGATITPLTPSSPEPVEAAAAASSAVDAALAPAEAADPTALPEQGGMPALALVANGGAAPEPNGAPPPQTLATSSAAPEQNGASLPPALAPSPAPEQNEERPQRVGHEPIRTRTMARLLAAQGYRQRALAIYDELLARAGGDECLRAEADALRSRAG